MTLIYELPTYTLNIPSNGESVRYRPFTVGEQELLNVANETGTDTDKQCAMDTIIKSCCIDQPKNMTISDSIYCFSLIRSKSIEETVDMILVCSDCEKDIEVTIDITKYDIEPPTDTFKEKISLNDKMGICVRKVSLLDVVKFTKPTDIIKECILSIWNGETVTDTKSMAKDELSKFVASLSPKKLTEIENNVYLDCALTKTIEATCPSCNTKNTNVVASLINFFV